MVKSPLKPRAKKPIQEVKNESMTSASIPLLLSVFFSMKIIISASCRFVLLVRISEVLLVYLSASPVL